MTTLFMIGKMPSLDVPVFQGRNQNSLLYIVRPCRGGICHTKDKAGAPRNCYYRKIDFDTLKLSFVDSCGKETV